MSSDEEFGFGFDEGEDEAPQELHSITDLERIIQDCDKQIALTMDELVQQKLRHAKKDAQEKLSVLRKEPVETKIEGQWADMERAYGEFYGNQTEFTECLKSLGGSRTSEVFETLRNKLARAHSLKEEAKTKRASKKTKVVEPKDMPTNTPESRWPAIVLHGQNCGQDAQIIFDELGLSEVTHDTCNAVLSEINRRNQPEVEEEFGTGEPFEGASESVPVPAASSSSSPPAAAGVTSIEHRIDPETGEILDRHWILDRLGWVDFPQELTEESADQIVDCIRGYLDAAARYRQQAEKRAKPKEERAAAITELFGQLLDRLGEARLPRFQKGAKAGQFSKKTLDLASGSISWTKAGGIACIDEPRFHIWLSERKQELLAAREAGDEETLAVFEKQYGMRLKTELDYSRDKIKGAEQLPPGWEDLGVDEFARRVIK